MDDWRCYVSPPRSECNGFYDVVAQNRHDYVYHSARGVTTFASSPACRYWRWKMDETMNLSTPNSGTKTCGNCYFYGEGNQ
jgi:hypothetical protein